MTQSKWSSGLSVWARRRYERLCWVQTESSVGWAKTEYGSYVLIGSAFTFVRFDSTHPFFMQSLFVQAIKLTLCFFFIGFQCSNFLFASHSSSRQTPAEPYWVSGTGERATLGAAEKQRSSRASSRAVRLVRPTPPLVFVSNFLADPSFSSIRLNLL